MRSSRSRSAGSRRPGGQGSGLSLRYASWPGDALRASAAPGLSLLETTLVIPQVDYEGALYKTPGDPYPHLDLARVRADRVVDKAHRAIVMGARLMLIRGRVQRTGDIIHVVASRILDRSHWLARLAEDHAGFRAPLARADEVVRPGPDPAQTTAARHPRQI